MSWWIRLIVLAAYVLLSLSGLYGMKRAESLFAMQFAVGLALYVLGFGVWLVMLRLYPLSLAFPLAAGSLVVGTQILGWWFLSEHVAVHRVVGVLFIISGLAILAGFDKN